MVDIEDTLAGTRPRSLKCSPQPGTPGRRRDQRRRPPRMRDHAEAAAPPLFHRHRPDTRARKRKAGPPRDGTRALLAETRGEVAGRRATGRRATWRADSGLEIAPVTAAQLEAILTRSGRERSSTAHGTAETCRTLRSRRRTHSDLSRTRDTRPTGRRITWADILDPGWTFNGYDDVGGRCGYVPTMARKPRRYRARKGFERCSGGATPVLVVHSSSAPHLPSGGGHGSPRRGVGSWQLRRDEAAALAALEAAVTTGDMDRA